MLLFYILLVAFGCQQTPFLESENLKNSESEKGCEPRAMSNEPFSETEKSVNISEICGNEKTNHKLVQKKSEKGSEPRAMSNEQKSPNAQSSQLEAQSLKKTVDCCPLTVDYFENQIRLADSLYKNYLPQYNFEEVKAAVMFFDSLRLTTDLLESENLKTSESEKRLKSQGRNAQSSQLEAQSTSQVFSFSDSQIQNNVDHHELLKFQNSKILEFLRARAHYYHAVGLTERDDIVGACEHYFIALEIMETESENLKTSKYRKGSEQRAMSHEQKFRNAHSSKLEAQSPDYEKIRFIALIYTRLGRLFYNENYCDLAILKYKKALKYVLLLGENKAVADTYKCLGNSYQLYDMPDSALYYYNKSLETNSELPNRLDVEKCIAQILFDRGEKDSAYVMIKNNLDKIEDYSSKDSYYAVLGDMYYKDMEYDSAIFYLEKSILNHDYYIKHLSSTNLSAIYDSNGDYDKKVHYDNIISRLSVKKIDESIENNKLQSVYDNYKERKYERERIEYIREKRQIIISLSGIVFFVLILALLIMYKSKRKESVFSTSMSEMKKAIIDKDTMIGRTNEEIKQKDSVIKRYSQEIEDNKKIIDILRKDIETNKQEISNMEANVKKLKKDLSDNETKLGKLRSEIDKKNDDVKNAETKIEEIRNNLRNKEIELSDFKKEIENKTKEISRRDCTIKKQKKELDKLKRDNERKDRTVTFKDYYESDICKKILRKKEIDFTALSEDELALLLEAADKHLGGMTKKLCEKYPRLRKEDLNCICLILLNIGINRLHYLLGRNRKTVWERIKRIKNIMNIGDEKDLYLSLKEELCG